MYSQLNTHSPCHLPCWFNGRVASLLVLFHFLHCPFSATGCGSPPSLPPCWRGGQPIFIHLPLPAVGHGKCLWFAEFFVRGHPLFSKYHPCNWRRHIITVSDTAGTWVACWPRGGGSLCESDRSKTMLPLMCIEVVLRMPALFLSPLRFLFQLPGSSWRRRRWSRWRGSCGAGAGGEGGAVAWGVTCAV